jgi:hypothetical protein
MLEFRDGRVFERVSKPQVVQSVGRVWSFRDITNQKRSERELEHLANHDGLTGPALWLGRAGQSRTERACPPGWLASQ